MVFSQKRKKRTVREVSDVPISERLISVGGIQALTTIDFPGKIAAVVFTRGCPWNCRYCHNPELRQNGDAGFDAIENIEKFLKERAGFLEGIVLSGGEPTYQKKLPGFLKWVRNFGYDTALHTNGFFPEMLRRVLSSKLVDFVAMDIKAPPLAYSRITGMENSCISVARSIQIILSSGVDYEFRTTYHPDILSEEELKETVNVVSSVGAKRYFIQRFRSHGVADEELTRSCDISSVPDHIAKEAEKLFDEFAVR